MRRLRIPFYSTREQWDLEPTKEVKKMCKKYGLPVPRDYDYTKIDDETFLIRLL